MAEFLKALAALLWPILGFVFLWTFRNEIRGLLQRIRKGKFLGQEIELDEDLKELHQSAERAEEAAEERVGYLPSEDVTTEIFREAARSPRAALLLLAAELEQSVREKCAAAGWPDGKRMRLREAIDELGRQGNLPAHVTETFRLFMDVRNRLVHGHEADDDDILRAIDSGVLLLRTIDAIPIERNVVKKIDVPLYSDPDCKNRITGVSGVILETTSPGGAQKHLRIFPTTKTDFQIGKSVSCERNMTEVWEETWYKDEAGVKKLAWHSCAEFVGRPLEEI